MRKSTRALVGMVVLDLLILLGAWWMLLQVRTGAWNAPDPALAGQRIGEVAGAAIGVITALLLVAFVVHRRRGN
jgi:hypothetical protein